MTQEANQRKFFQSSPLAGCLTWLAPPPNSPRASESFVEAGVGAGGLEQFVVGAAFDDVAVVEDQDEVGVADCAQAVGDHETGAAREQHGQCALQALLGRFGFAVGDSDHDDLIIG